MIRLKLMALIATLALGLGLSLAREIAQLHGGRIEIESNVGEGTVVAVYFPIHRGL